MAQEHPVLNYGRQVRQFYGLGNRTLHRLAVTSADFLEPSVTTLANVASTAGALSSNTPYNAAAAPGNSSGPGPAGSVVSVTVTNDGASTHRVRLTIPQVTGADFYDIFLSAHAAPKWVARITEDERAAGCVINTDRSVGSGGTAGAVDIGQQGVGNVQTNQAPYNDPDGFARIFEGSDGFDPIDCAGYSAAIVTPEINSTAPDAVSSVTLSLWILDDADTFHFVTSRTFTFFDADDKYATPVWAVDVYGSSVVVLVDELHGTEPSIDVYVQPAGY